MSPDYLDIIDGEQSNLQIVGYLALRNDGTDFDIISKAKRFKLKFEFPDITIDNYVDGSATFRGAVPKKGKVLRRCGTSRVNADLRTDGFYRITNINSRIDAGIEKGGADDKPG